MNVLTAGEMRAVDRRTEELGIPAAVLMENAGHRVVELLERKFSPLRDHRIVILCGKGNNGGDGLVVARQLFTRFRPASLDVVLAEQPPANLASLTACGCAVHHAIEPRMRAATIVVDALLGTGLTGPPRDPYAALIASINTDFPAAKIVSVDIPSGLQSDSAETAWDHVRAHYTVTFTAPKPALVLDPAAAACGEWCVGHIGSPRDIVRSGLFLTEPADIAPLFAPRDRRAHKGTFGHALVIGGGPGKTGAAAMAGLAALRAGAGLVTVSSSAAALPSPEIMTEALPGTAAGLGELTRGKTVVAVGPGLGLTAAAREIVNDWLGQWQGPLILDADALTLLERGRVKPRSNWVLTPHPGEMARLTGLPAADVQARRREAATAFARDWGVVLALKGRNTLTALPDGSVWINPTGGPAMAKGGSGDVLTGLIAGLAAQFPGDLPLAVTAAVWLHGRCGDLAAREFGEKCVLATDLLRYLPAAMEECARALD